MNAKKITILLVDGLPKGIRRISIEHQWSGKCVCAPRNRLKDMIDLLKGLENGSCVYFLVGDSGQQSLPMVYVGQAEKFQQRIKGHENDKDWKEAIVFYSSDGSLTRTGIQYLESICVQKLQKAGRSFMWNGNIPKTPHISQEDACGLDAFFENIALIIPLLGYDIFVESVGGSDTKLQHLFCNAKGIKSEGVLLNDGKIKVLKGSQAVLKNVDSFEAHPYRPLKDELIRIQRLIPNKGILIFSDDYVFDSPSAAAAVILARSSSGPATWKTKNGKTLKEILEGE
jgi:hypothetical protein